MEFKVQRIKKVFVIAALLLVSCNAWALTIDLNTFTSTPSTSIAVSADGSSATFSEDPVFSPVALERLGLSIPTDAISLSFDYRLTVPVGNEDYFDFYLADLSAPLFSVGGFADPGVSSTTLGWADTYSTDISSFSGSLDLIFAFTYGWDDTGFDSSLTISNLVITQPMTVPEPTTLLLLVSGLLMVSGARSLRM